MKKCLFIAVLSLQSNLYTCSEEEVEKRRDQRESILSVSQLSKRPVGWLTQKQFDMLRIAHHNHPEFSFFKTLNVSLMEILQTSPSLLTFSEMIIFEQVAKKSFVLTDEEEVLVK